MDRMELAGRKFMTCPNCDGQGGTDGYDQSGEPTHAKATCPQCMGEGEILAPTWAALRARKGEDRAAF